MKAHSAPLHEKPYYPHRPLSVILFAFVFSLGMLAVRDPATWLHVRCGGRILAEGALPRTDTFSYGAGGAAWTTNSWLSDVLFARLDAAGGAVLLAAVKSLAVAAAFGALLPINHGSPLIAATLLSAGACAAWAGLAETPLAFDFLFFAFFVRLLRPRRRFRWLDAAAAVSATVLWANVHGASACLALWLVGLKVFKTSLRTATSERFAYWAMLAACAIAFSWNPLGYGLLARAFSDAVSGAGTWRTPLLSPAGLFLLAGAGACWLTLQQEFVTTLSCSTVMALSLVFPGLRPLGVLAACPVIALALGHMLTPQEDTRPRVLRWSAVPLVLLVAYALAIARPLRAGGGYGAPFLAGAASFLSSRAVGGRMFNDLESGDELIGLGGRPVFVDSRRELYSDSFLADAAEWPRRLGSLDAIYRFDYAVLRNRRALWPARVLDSDPQWRLAYADDRALVYVKKTGPNAGTAARSPFRILTPNRLWPDALDPVLADPAAASQAQEELARWLQESPDCVQALLWRAYALSRSGRRDEANAQLSAALARDAWGDNPELQAIAAFVSQELGRPEQAERLYRDAARRARRLGDAALQLEIEGRLRRLRDSGQR